MKISTVMPIRKIKGTNKCEEFRPINMLPTIEKIFEKIVYKQIVEYIEKQNIICTEQSGFRQKHNCETAIQNVIYDWKNNLENNEVTVALFLDLKRAFETLDRERLLTKLKSYGIGGSVLGWLKNYLENRLQRTKCGNSVSGNREIDIGVPQGSVLGPLLFLLYINDIGKAITLCNYHLFADDTLLYLAGKNCDEVIEQLNSILGRLNQWLQTNKLKLNIDKTKCMIISSKEQHPTQTVKIDNQCIEVVHKIKYLGIIVDNRLHFRDHAEYISGKIAQKIGVLRRVRSNVSAQTALLIYKTIVLPHFIYCPTVLYSMYGGDVERLQKLQNMAMRVILKCNRYTKITDMLNTLEWLNVTDLIKLKVLQFIHKIKLGLAPEYLSHKLNPIKTVHKYATRQCDNLYLQSVTKHSSVNALFYKGIRLYNKLPDYTKNCKNIKSFNRDVKQWLLSRE